MKIEHLAATYLLILFGLTSCASDPDPYDRYNQGDSFSRPGNPGNMYQNGAPYQQGNQPYQQSPYGQPQYQQPYQQNPYGQPQYQQQYQQNPYGQPYQQQPGSRYYSNPYALPPSQSPYFNGYDADQYYVPPTGYGVERNDISGLNTLNKL